MFVSNRAALGLWNSSDRLRVFMIPDRTLVQDYLATLGGDSEEIRFLRSVPWICGSHWQDHDDIIKALRGEVLRFAELPEAPRFTLLTPLWNTPPRLLQELILSVRCQSWQRWELILVDDGSVARDHLEVAGRWAERDGRIRLFARAENQGISRTRNEAIVRSSGDFLAILDHDDLLHPLALGILARHLHGVPDANLLYTNEAKINDASDWVGYYLNKPPFDHSTLLRVNFLCHLTAIRRDLLEAAARDGLIFRPQYDGAEDHDLFLRIALTGQVKPIHVPMCLYYWRMVATSTAWSPATKPDIELRRKAMLDELVPEFYRGARWSVRPPAPGRGHQYPSIRLLALAGQARPQLLVMVPFKDNLDLTLHCLESVERQEHDLDVRVILIDNSSHDEATQVGLRQWLATPRRHCYVLAEHAGAFNYARMHNLAVARHGADRDLLLFLNNDVELISPDCLQTLALHLLADEACAFAGIRLDFPDGSGIQHGGIAIDEQRLTCGFYPFSHAREATDYVGEERVVFGVTFACAMVRREVFERLGGLDEVMLPNAYGDVDLQARALELGYRNFYFGTLSGTHNESTTRGRASEECQFLALHQRHAGVISAWKLGSFRLSLQEWTTAVERAPAPVPVPEPVCPPASPVRPLRYRLADRMNQALKRGLGPVHPLLRAGLVGTARRLHRNGKPQEPAELMSG
jgi:GT2 family glycosyltransferase